MNYRKAELYSQTDASTAKEETIDIEIQDIISRIQLKYNSTNGSHACTGHPALQISSVKIVSGSEVLMQLSGQQIEAIMFYETGQSRAYELEYRNGVENRSVYDIYFGRKLYDPDLAFDPTKFKNPQLKITHNKALGGSTPSASTLEVFADVFDEKKVTPSGYIMNKEHHSYAPAASAWERIELPADYPIRKLYLMGTVADKWWDNIFDKFKIQEENSKKVPLELDAYDVMSLNISKYGMYKEVIAACSYGVGTYSWYVTPHETVGIGAIGYGSGSNPYPVGETVGGYISMGTGAVIVWRALIEGPIPHGVIPFETGDPANIDDWWDLRNKGTCKFEVKATSSPGTLTAYLVTQQYRKY
jgi:hypothetical protein